MPRLPLDATVLCGAGVSFDSHLPDGRKLASLAFGEVARGCGVYPAKAINAVKRQLDRERLRLEVVLDLMAKEVPSRTLAGVYSAVEGARPARPHHILVRLGVPVVTTNQDELLEMAARAHRLLDVLHLHGRATDLRSVVTMLSQYVEGLPRSTAAAFTSRVTGRHVIVIGYSGRDRDIMPYLYHAARITWLRFEGAQGAQDLSPEAQLLKDELGSRMRVVDRHDPAQWLYERLSVGQRSDVDRLSKAAPPGSFTSSLSVDAKAAFDAITLRDRRLAVARVLVHCNEAEYAYHGLRFCLRSWPKDPRVAVRLAATAEVVQRRPEALSLYARAASLAADPALRASALLGRAHVNANSGDHATALDELRQATSAAKAVRDLRTRRRLLTRILNLRARIKVMTNQEAEAAEDYRRAAETADRNHDLDGMVTARIFGSDAQHSRGRYRAALTQLAEVMEDNVLYGRPQTRVWGHFYRGLTLCSSGLLQEGLRDLRTCRDGAAQTGNHQAVAWSEVALASYVRASDARRAESHLAACENAIAAHGAPLTVCQIRLEWERAELARARGRDSDALDLATELESRIADPGLGMTLPYMPPHLLAIRAEIARHRHDADAADLLLRARDQFRAGGWRHSAVRMDVALWLLRGRSRPPARLLDRCRRYEYRSEVQRLLKRMNTYYPLHSW
ncbi:hypothetical protein [Amycolatopsis sp. cmx-4-61]|uniref:hypothetical protein n=1 Tax=Amycolatopsis sp. cmx-4-61 TaxID=2790937 RepID=UPI00397BC053